MTQSHDEVETLKVDVIIPDHADRVTTPLFKHSRDALIEREGGRCWVCGRTEAEAGHPLEAHHHPIERSMAEMIDWRRFSVDCKAGLWGPHAADYGWDGFFVMGPAHDGDQLGLPETVLAPKDIYAFVDDMTVNGMILCKDHHTVGDEGIHTLPFPLFVAQKYGKDGYQFNSSEVLHHEETL